MISLTSMVQFFGVLCGTIFYGSLADRYGRKPIAILVLSSGLSSLFASGKGVGIINLNNLKLQDSWNPLGNSWLLDIWWGWRMEGLLWLFVPLWWNFSFPNKEWLSGHIQIGYLFKYLSPKNKKYSESKFKSKFRYSNHLVNVCFWNIIIQGNARLMSTLISFFLPHWRHASVACSLFALPALLVILTVFPESPPWLFQQNRHSDFQSCKKYIAKLGGVPCEDTVEEFRSTPVKLKELWRNSKMRAMVGILCIMWFTASVSSYTNDLNSAAISGDFFTNQILLSIFIAISKIVLGLTDLFYPKFNRRSLHQYSQIAVIVCFLGVCILSTFEYKGVVLLLLNIFGTISIEWTWWGKFNFRL